MAAKPKIHYKGSFVPWDIDEVLKKVLPELPVMTQEEVYEKYRKNHREGYRGLAGTPLLSGDLEPVLEMASQQLKADINWLSTDRVNIEILQIGSMCVVHTNYVRGNVTIPYYILIWRVDDDKAADQYYFIRSERNW